MLGGLKGVGKVMKGKASMAMRGTAAGSSGQMVKSGMRGLHSAEDVGNAGRRIFIDGTQPAGGGLDMFTTAPPMGTPLPGRGLASRADYGNVLEARRQAKLASSDPGLSTRGRVRTTAATRGAGLEGRGVAPMPGSRVMGPSTRTLETRGVRPMPGTRVRGASTGGLETRGVRPAPGSRMMGPSGPAGGSLRNVRQNVNNSQQVRVARQQAAARNARRQKERIIGNIEESKAGNTGGFRRSGVGRPGPTASRGPTVAQPTVTSGTGATAGKSVSAGNQPRSFRNMDPKTRRMLMIGGAAAVGVTAASNRRGQGTSSGRQSMTRY